MTAAGVAAQMPPGGGRLDTIPRFRAVARVGVRAQAAFDSAVVGAVEVGEVISVLQEANQSAQFAQKSDGALGWVSLTNALRPVSPIGPGHAVRLSVLQQHAHARCAARGSSEDKPQTTADQKLFASRPALGAGRRAPRACRPGAEREFIKRFPFVSHVSA